MKKKVLLAVMGAFSILTLAACSNKSNQEIASMKGAKFTVSDFYDHAKIYPASQEMAGDMILSKVFTEKYGNKVSKDMIQEEIKKQFGDNFDSWLKTSSFTRKDVESIMKSDLAKREGIKSHVKLSDADLKAAWETFHPEVEAQLIAVVSEDDAKKIKEEASATGADFGKIASEKSLLPSKKDNGTVKFDSSTAVAEVPNEVKQVAWNLKDNAVSDVIPVNGQYGATYYVIKMVKNQAKGNDMKPFEEKVKEIATNAKLSDESFVNKAIGQELIDANVKIQEKNFSNILTKYIEAAQPAKKTEDSNAKDNSEKATETTKTSTEKSTTESSK